MFESAGDKNVLDRRVLLSALWIVVMINMLKADVLSLYIPGTTESLAEFAGTTPIPLLMLGGAVMMQLGTLMIFLSLVLPSRLNRWANGVVSLITAAFVIGGGSLYPHYLFIASVEVICLLAILWLAWRWSPEKTSRAPVPSA